MGLCVSLLRTQSADAAAELVVSLITLLHPRVVVLSIDGNEAAAGRTGPRFAGASYTTICCKATEPSLRH